MKSLSLLKEVKPAVLLLLTHLDVHRPRRYIMEEGMAAAQLCVTEILI